MTNWRSMIRTADLEQLEANWTKQQPLKGTRNEQDFTVVCRLFDPYGSAEWVITELDPNSSLAFGWADMGVGYGEMGYFCLEEIASLTIAGERRIEQDLYFSSHDKLSSFVAKAKLR